MAELPTPHSIAIGTLIALYSDPNSPLVVLDWHQSKQSEDGVVVVVGSSAGGDGEPKSTAEWSLRLMTMIQQLVLREDEGLVVLPNTDDEFGFPHDDDDDDENPANDNNDDGMDNDVINRDPMREMDNILNMNDDDFFKRHNGNGILDDVLGGLFGTDGSSSLPAEMQSTTSLPVGKRKQSTRSSGAIRNNATGGGSLKFCMEPLSALLDRIDDAFATGGLPVHPNRSRRKRKQQQRKRTPPSLAILSRLQMASASVDDLMNLLDEWHALLEGTHMGYPPSTKNGSNNPNVPAAMIAIDGESTFGIYLRKLCLGMEEIPFEALARLWDALREFVREEMGWQKGLEIEQQHAEGNNVHVMNASSDWLPSSPQIERIVRNTCLQNNLSALLRSGSDTGSNTNIQSSAFSSNRNQLYHDLLSTHPECPSIHFLLFLTSLANGQRSAALESLHRYFDYAMIHERKERAERALMLQAFGGDETGIGGNIAASGIVGMTGMSAMASGMGGITGGMTGGIVNGAAVGGNQLGASQRGAGGVNNAQTKIFRESNVMQYAAILLAQTYHRFGYAQLSLRATEEAVRVAQQGGDEECVCFANGWLALVGSSLGNNNGNGNGDTGIGDGRQSVYASVGGLTYYHDMRHRPLAAAASTASSSYTLSPREEEAMLHRCQTRASECGLASLAAGASLELARRMAYRRPNGDDDMEEANGDQAAGASLAWTSIQSAGRMPALAGASGGRGVRLGMGAAAAATTTPVGQAPTDIYNMTPTEASSVLGRQNIAIAGLWESSGHASMASLSACAALDGSGSGLTAGNDEESKMAMNRVLSSFTNGPGLDVWTAMDGRKDSHLGENYAAILNNITSISNSQEPVSSTSSMALHEWSVRSYDYSMAQGLHTLLANHAAFPSDSGDDSRGALAAVESSLAFLAQSTHLFCQREEYDRAKASARRACWLASRHGLIYHQGWSLLQLAIIDTESSPTSPERALPPLLECISLAERYSMDPLTAIALTTLAKVLLCMGRCKKARAVLCAAMPLVMQHGHVWFQGEAFLTSAKCHLAEVADCSVSSETIDIGRSGKRKRTQQQLGRHEQAIISPCEMHETAISELKKAAIHFKQIEDIQRLREVYYLQARVYGSLPNAKKKRDEAAKIFVQLSTERRERMANPIMAMLKKAVKQDVSKQWEAMRGVMITDSDDLQLCVSLRRQR